MWKQGESIEWAAGDFEQLLVGVVIDEGDNAYYVLVNKEGQFAGAQKYHDQDDWWFVNDSETTWRNEKHVALGDIVLAMHDLTQA